MSRMNTVGAIVVCLVAIEPLRMACFASDATDKGTSRAAETRGVRFETIEPIGVHRDPTPVHLLLHLGEAVDRTTKFRLVDDAGQPVVAQFRPDGDAARVDRWWLDFLATSPPRARRTYVVEFGPNVSVVPERQGGHQLERTDDGFVVSNPPYIDWVVPRDLAGFLRSVDFPPSEHLRPNAPGLVIIDRDGHSHTLGGVGTRVRVVREGRMTVALQFQRKEVSPKLKGVEWTADLVFPGPVSWVDLRVALRDPEDRVAGVGMHLNLNLDPPTGNARTLVELCGSRTVYRSIYGNQQVELRYDGRNPWQILRGTEGRLTPFVVGPNAADRPEGWAHIMDRQRCLAIAFDRFGLDGEERLNVNAQGVLRATKRFSSAEDGRGSKVKRWRAWLHFVHFPPQQSAGTDPRMMQSPLLVRQIDD